MRAALVLALAVLPVLGRAQTETVPNLTPIPSHPTTTSALQDSVDQLTKTNRDLLDLLKKQQGVLEDIQVDRRLQSRQIKSLEERLQETLLENAKLQNKIDTLMAAGNAPPPTNPPNGTPPGKTLPNAGATNALAKPVPPATYLPPPPGDAAPGVPSWHRLFTLAGTDNKSTDLFHIEGRQWRIVWHNQDKEGAAYKNTSALFLNAFPKDDTIPQKACSQLGSGGGTSPLIGPGNFFVKIEASGGSWELAVEDFH